MRFNSHSAIAGKHALLSPSNYHWINYTEQKLDARYFAARQAARGTALHDLAHNAIKLGVKLSNAEKTLAAYVADGIRYKMQTEVALYYSDNCFGHADTISFNKSFLRIHDLKTGINQCSEHQLEIYAALFCLEYGFFPHEIGMELRIYQSGEVHQYTPDPGDIAHIMDRIVTYDRRIQELREEDAR
jgi:hypothetical protein